MPDKKISELTSASLPLSGSEVVPIVQDGQTRKVSVDEIAEVSTQTLDEVCTEGNFTNSNIGIGTTSPNTLIDVSSVNIGETAPTVRITNTKELGNWSGVTDDLGRFEFFTDDASGNAPYTLGYVGIKNDRTSSGTLPSGAMVLATTTYNAVGGAVERMRITSNGDVGIGTTSPSKKLDVAGDWILDGIAGGHFENYTFGSQLDISELTSGGWARANRIVTSDSDAYVFSGVVGDGTTLTRAYWTIGSSSDAIGYTYSNGINLLKNGNVGIGTTSPSYKLDVSGTGRFTGDVRGLSFITTSQRDQKENINNIDKSKAKAIPFKEYTYKSSIDGSARKRYGVIAEDIENDYPELVHTGADGVKGINYIDLLVKRVAELEKELEDISLTSGPKGDTGDTGPQGPSGADGNDGNSHLSNVDSITFDERENQLVLTINRTDFRFSPVR